MNAMFLCLRRSSNPLLIAAVTKLTMPEEPPMLTYPGAETHAVMHAAYNCVLEVFATMENMQNAKEVFQRMDGNLKLNLMIYNGLLKGYCNHGDIERATKLRSVMEAHDGLMPNDFSAPAGADVPVPTSLVTLQRAVRKKALKKKQQQPQVQQ